VSNVYPSPPPLISSASIPLLIEQSAYDPPNELQIDRKDFTVQGFPRTSVKIQAAHTAIPNIILFPVKFSGSEYPHRNLNVEKNHITPELPSTPLCMQISNSLAFYPNFVLLHEKHGIHPLKPHSFNFSDSSAQICSGRKIEKNSLFFTLKLWHALPSFSIIGLL